jgi:hypothetical protein
VVEVACDESGYEGEKLVGGSTVVFAHGSVGWDLESANACMRELRERIRSPATEYKANHLLREKHRWVLLWLIGPDGPLLGHAHVCLLDKPFHLLSKLVEILLEGVAQSPYRGFRQDDRSRATALALYRHGRRAFRSEHWDAFLEAVNNLLRVKERLDTASPVDSFYCMVDVLLSHAEGPSGEVLRRLRGTRAVAEEYRAGLTSSPDHSPALDPLIPAIVQDVLHWGRGADRVAIVHDRQNTLSQQRVAQLKLRFDEPGLAGLRLVEAACHVPIQLADIIAGVARQIATDQLNGNGDPELTELLRPYVDGQSVWGDERSWAALHPA